MTDRGDPNDRERLGRDTGGGGSDRDRDSGRETGRDERDSREYGRDRADSGQGRVHEQNPNRGRGWGIAALILSILAVIFAVVFFPIGILLAVVGLILGIVALRKGSRGLGIASIILSILAVIIAVVILFVIGAVVSSPEFQQQLQELQQQAD